MKTAHSFPALLAGLFSLVFVPLLVSGCGGKKEVVPVPVGELEAYHDPVLRFAISHPKGWSPDCEAGLRAKYYSAEGVKERFLDPTGAYPDGVSMAVEVTRTSEGDSARKSLMDAITSIGFVVQKIDTITHLGHRGIRYTYAGNFGSGIIMRGDRTFFNLDTVLYEVAFAGFGTLYESHKNVFNAAFKTFEFPKPVPKGADATLPSQTMSLYDGKGFSFQYPENYNFVSANKGTSESVLELRGVRQDCAIRLNVFPAQKLTAQKVMEQNMKNFRTAVKGQTTLGGQPAPYFTYPATKDVERRFYFAVKDDKVYRFTMDWFRPQREQYLAVYDNVVRSFRFK
jgi:hypothetical protein